MITVATVYSGDQRIPFGRLAENRGRVLRGMRRRRRATIAAALFHLVAGLRTGWRARADARSSARKALTIAASSARKDSTRAATSCFDARRYAAAILAA